VRILKWIGRLRLKLLASADQSLWRDAVSRRWKDLVKVIEAWPSERQEDAARILDLLVEQGAGPYELSEEERERIERSRAQARRGEFATDEEVAAVLRKHGL
jgi:hypothetical protein